MESNSEIRVEKLNVAANVFFLILKPKFCYLQVFEIFDAFSQKPTKFELQRQNFSRVEKFFCLLWLNGRFIFDEIVTNDKTFK
jgi:hypothetical protein